MATYFRMECSKLNNNNEIQHKHLMYTYPNTIPFMFYFIYFFNCYTTEGIIEKKSTNVPKYILYLYNTIKCTFNDRPDL